MNGSARNCTHLENACHNPDMLCLLLATAGMLFFQTCVVNERRVLCRPWRFLLVDQRCHGRSLGIGRDTDPSTVGASARDLGKFIDAKLSGRSIDFLAGHSLGGKVVLDLLQQQRHDPPTNQVGAQLLTAKAETPRAAIQVLGWSEGTSISQSSASCVIDAS